MGFHRPPPPPPPPRWGYGPGLHRRPGPPSLVGWRRGLIHPHYRSCWYDNVWYDAAGYAYYAPGYTATTVVQQPAPVVVQQPATVVTQPGVAAPVVQQPVVTY